MLCLASAVVIPLVALTLESPASLASRSLDAAARHTLSVALTHRFPTSLGRCHASMAIITPLAARRAPPQRQSASGGAGAGWDTAGGRGDAERGRCGGWDTAGGGGSELPLSARGEGAQGGPMEAVRLRTADSAAAEAVRREIASQGDYSHHGPHATGERGAGVLIPLGGGDDAGGASSSRGSRSSGRSHPPTAESSAPKLSSAASARHSTASSAGGAQGCWGVCRAWGGPLTVTGLCWLAVALLYYGLDFAANGCEAANGCDKYSHLALYCLFDVPGYILGYVLADLPAIGRKRALGISLALAGGCLMLTPPLQALAPGSGAEIALALSLAGEIAWVSSLASPAPESSSPLHPTAPHPAPPLLPLSLPPRPCPCTHKPRTPTLSLSCTCTHTHTPPPPLRARRVQPRPSPRKLAPTTPAARGPASPPPSKPEPLPPPPPTHTQPRRHPPPFSGKLGASSGFVLAYMLPAEIFPIRMRGLAIGVANIFARCGSILAPLCGSAPPLVVQTGLGSMALTICALAMVALPDLRPSATRAD